MATPRAPLGASLEAMRTGLREGCPARLTALRTPCARRITVHRAPLALWRRCSRSPRRLPRRAPGDAVDRRRRRRPRRRHEPGRGARLAEHGCTVHPDPRPLLLRHRDRHRAGEHRGEGAGWARKWRRPARALRARRGLGGDVRQLAAGRAGGAGGGQPHLRAHRPRRGSSFDVYADTRSQVYWAQPRKPRGPTPPWRRPPGRS